jgi:CHAT domain-containing protein
MTTDRKRLKRLIAGASVFAVAVAIVFAWMTAPDDQFSQASAPVVPTRNPSPESAPLVVFPDRGEPRTTRLAHLEAVVRAYQSDSNRSAGEYAYALLSLADVRIQLNRFAGAQESVEVVKQLATDPDSWQVREAELLQQDLRAREAADDTQLRIRKDRADHHAQALKLHAAGEYLNAVSAARQAVALQRQLMASSDQPSDSDRARLADELLLLGRLAFEHSDTYLEAEGILQQAIEYCRAVRGSNHPALAEFLTALARVEDDRGNFESANALYEEALDVLRATRGELNLDFARTLALQGRMHLDWWEDYAAGKGYRALQIRQELLGDDHLECVESFEHLGMNALWLLNFDKAEELLQRALAIRQREQGQHHPDTAESQSWLSQVFIALGDVARASIAMQDAIQLTKKHHGESHPRLVRFLANLARLGSDEWNQPRGEREGRRAIDIAARMGTSGHPATLDAMVGTSDLMLEEESPYGVAQVRRVNPAYIADFLRDVMRAYESNPRIQQLPAWSMAMINLAHVGYWDDYASVTRDEAAALLESAMANMRQHGSDLHPSYSEYLNVLGRWHLWNGDEDAGRGCLKESLEVVEQRYGRETSGRRASAWRSFAGAYMHAGQHSKEMDECLRTVIRNDDDIFRRNAAGQCDVDRYCISRARFFTAGVCVLHPGVSLTDAERYTHIVSTKGETAKLQQAERALYERPEFQQILERVRDVRRRLKTIAYDLPRDPKEHVKWREQLFVVADEKESRERELAIQARPYLPEGRDIDASFVQARLPADTVLLDFVYYTELGPPKNGRGRLSRTRKLAVFVVQRDRDVQFISLGPSDVIERSIDVWLESLRSQQPNPSSTAEQAREVAKLLWEPVRSAVGDKRMVLIAPDGPICFVPFAALPGQLPGTWLIEDVTIGYVPSVRQWLDLLDRRDEAHIDGLLAVGDVDYRRKSFAENGRVILSMRAFNPADAEWEDLPATRAEAEQICSLLESSTPALTAGPARTRLLTGEEPTIETLQAALSERWRYFHFAGHGLFADLQTDWGNRELTSVNSEDSNILVSDEAIVFGRAPQLLSGLVLTTAKDSQNPSDAILTAEEVGGFDLRGTEMVVLSACETGLGNTIGGEGVLGLQRAFLNAGARSTVTSLWKVNDAATSVLMERFYARLWKDRLPKWEALRQAQLDVLRDPQLLQERETLLVVRGLLTGKTVAIAEESTAPVNRDDRTDPSLWGAFVLYGDGR